MVSSSVWMIFCACALLQFLSAWALPAGPRGTPRQQGGQGIAQYKLIFNTLWSEDVFPKQYPKFRPPAQWSILSGRTHGGHFTMWRIGEVVSDGFRDFAESGNAYNLDIASLQGHGDVLDVFHGRNVPEGVGEEFVTFFADRSHSKVSFATRIIPSPDWFVGVDSLELYDTDQGRWRDSLTFDLHPMDAGTDKGFTFTSPNWEEEPRGPVSAITSKFPDHPANSFFYPEMDQLPPIARATLQLVQLFEAGGSCLNEDVTVVNVTGNGTQAGNGTEFDDRDVMGDMIMSNVTEAEINEEVQQQPQEVDERWADSGRRPGYGGAFDLGGGERYVQGGEWRQTGGRQIAVARPFESGGDWAEVHEVLEEEEARHHDGLGNPRGLPQEESPQESREEPTEESAEEDTRQGPRRQREKKRKRNRKNRKRQQGLPEPETTTTSSTTTTTTRPTGPVDCVPGDWGEWSACSKTCGYGYRTRVRLALVEAQNGGRECPVISQEQMCGSMRNCGGFRRNQFKFSQWGWPST